MLSSSRLAWQPLDHFAAGVKSHLRRWKPVVCEPSTYKAVDEELFAACRSLSQQPAAAAMSTAAEPNAAALDIFSKAVTAGPLVQCITNFVSMDIMANALLAAGCSPAMAHALDEVEEFVAISSSLLINMGTLTSDWLASKKLAAKRAVALHKPWVLDPVGCGATTYRTAACVNMLKLQPTVVRGNASEILALAGAAGNTKGVDSTAASHEALDAARQLATTYNCVVAVSGARDLVTDGRVVLGVDNGVEMLTKITAAGCSVTALIAGFVAVAPTEPLLATAAGLAVFGLAGERGAKGAAGPGSLRVGLLDSLYCMAQSVGSKGSEADKQQVLEGLKISQLAS